MAVEETMVSPLIMAPQPTGRRLIRFEKDGGAKEAFKLLNRMLDIPPFIAPESGSLVDTLAAAAERDATIILPRFSVAAISGGFEASVSIAQMLQAEGLVVDTRPEFWMFALSEPPWADDTERTWGLTATGADQSAFSGAGIKLAVLDTGIDLAHPDYVSRAITHASFVPGESIDDVQGHGTHCAGTAAAGSPQAVNVPRYGVAPNAELFVAKVLNNRGAGRELDIIAGIEWALDNGCDIISMSLGRATGTQEPFDPLYEDIAAEALEAGCLIVAAAGNDSDRRYRYVAPVSSPANAPSIMAVAAIEADGSIAAYSNGGIGIGRIDVAAPGSGVFSSVPRPQLYRTLSGTSMACPHVAGIAALWAQSDLTLRGQRLWDQLVAVAEPIAGQSAIDIGKGLVKAP